MKYVIITLLLFLPLSLPLGAQDKPVKPVKPKQATVLKVVRPVVYIIFEDKKRTLYLFKQTDFTKEALCGVTRNVPAVRAAAKKHGFLMEKHPKSKTAYILTWPRKPGWYSKLLELYEIPGVYWLRPFDRTRELPKELRPFKV